MTNDMDLYVILRNNLHLVRLTNDSSEIIIRCPICGDSKNQNHAHFYIMNKYPFYYNCKKCESSGIFTSDLLQSVNVYDPNMALYINKSKMDYIDKYGLSSIRHLKKFKKVTVPTKYSRTPNNLNKIEYLKNRLNVDEITTEMLVKFKIIIDFKEFYKINKLGKIRGENRNSLTNKEILNYRKYDRSHIGFLSTDSTHVIFRNIDKYGKRYDTFRVIKNDKIAAKKYYTIKNTIDMRRLDLVVNICEGVFDAIGIYRNVYNNNISDNVVILAVNGKDYTSVIKEYIKKGFIDATFNIYSDSEVGLDVYRKMLYKLPFNSIPVIYNKKGDDFGVNDVEIMNTVATI